MFKEMSPFDIKEKIKSGWIKVWFAFDVIAARDDVAKSAIEKHIEKILNLNRVICYKKTISDSIKVENPTKTLKEGYSATAELELLVRNVFDLVNIVIVYGPSSIEIMEPDEVKIKIGDLQNMVNVISGVMHQFAQAGIGGFVIKS